MRPRSQTGALARPRFHKIDELRANTEQEGQTHAGRARSAAPTSRWPAQGGRGGACRRRGGAATPALALVPTRLTTPHPPPRAVTTRKSLRRVACAHSMLRDELGRFDMGRAKRVSGARFGYVFMGDAALVAMALNFRTRPPSASSWPSRPSSLPFSSAQEAVDARTGLVPTDRSKHLCARGAGPPHREALWSVALAALHTPEILEEPPAALHLVLSTCFAPRGRRCGGGDTPESCSFRGAPV